MYSDKEIKKGEVIYIDHNGISNEKINNTLKEKHLTSLLKRMAEDYASRDEYNFTYGRASAWYTKEKHFVPRITL